MNMKIDSGSPGWQDRHTRLYIETDGVMGHLVDSEGGFSNTSCLILKTIGRRSGEAKLLPLIYGKDGDRFVIVASKGGAPKHPAWFLNLEANPDVEFQVADKKYRGVAHVTQGAERDRLFKMMADAFPNYNAYKAKTDREIPVVVLEPQGEIERLTQPKAAASE
ncbi:MAG TPA: nitroreductase family deazaflavin-dependent oxidoreductase [Caulobacteraceae bacterium]|jgi:deazaflavin-dependent oxidoreductase (nitroreductase family)|nr:nitroreductase family deazaflavin-dependent oxidoreductase [Caulobacteraceae bacterium]